MKIKKLCQNWPPSVGTSARRPGMIKTDLDDTITSAFRYPDIKLHIILSLKKADGTAYEVILVLPAELLDTAIVVINGETPLTLREVGEIDI